MGIVEPRFAVEKSIKFRSHGSVHWHPGQTRNLSRSGLLFACDNDLAVGTVVELVLLEQDLNGQWTEGRLCHAEVVRRVLMAWPDIGLLVGARFLE